MSSAVIALRKAVRVMLASDTALAALLGGVKIFDTAPRDALTPYVTFGDALARDLSASVYPGLEHVLTLHVWSTQGGTREGLTIADRLIALVDDAGLTLDAHRLVNMRFTSLESVHEDLGRFVRVTLKFRAVTESA